MQDKVSDAADYFRRHRQKIRAWRFSNDRIVAAIDRKRAIGLLASREGRSYNTGIASRASQPRRGPVSGLSTYRLWMKKLHLQVLSCKH
jgi:hypothetical protein